MLKKIDLENPPFINSKLPPLHIIRMVAISIGLAGIGVFAFVTNFQSQPRIDLEKLTVVAKSEDLTQKISANGTVQSGQTVNLSPKTSGRVAKIFVKQGDLVKKGQIIAEMENMDIQALLLQRQASLRQAQANLAKSKNGSRPEEIAQAQAKLESAQAGLTRSQNGNRVQEIAQAQAKLSQFKALLAQTRSISPQQIQEANTQVGGALARLNLSIAKLNRTKSLHQQGAISQEKLDEANSDYQVNTASHQETQERLQRVKNNAKLEIEQRRAQVVEVEQSFQQQQLGSRQEDTAKAAAEMRQAQFALQQAKNGSRPEEIAQLQAAVDLAQAQGLETQVQFRDTMILAPFDGLITQRYANVGAFVTPTTTASKEGQATSTSIVAISKDLEVKAKVPEVDIGKITPGQKVEISADAYPDRVFHGAAKIIAPEAVSEQNVTTFEVRLTIDDDLRGALKSGMNVNTIFIGKQVAKSLMVPTVSIVRDRGRDGVLVPGKENRPEFKAVKLGFTANDKIQVLSGLQTGDRVFIDTPPGFQVNQEQRK
jgi:HlyD family secretion protein